MDKYIGIDVHSASCTIAVVDAHGKRVGLHVVATNGQEIVECLAAIPGSSIAEAMGRDMCVSRKGRKVAGYTRFWNRTLWKWWWRV
jgi:hypothetical protein